MNYRFKLIKTHLGLILFSVFATTLISSCSNQSAISGKAESHWVMLGSRTIEFVGTGNTDAMSVSDKGDYQQLRFKIESRGTTVQEITVTYFDGSQQELKNLDALMAPGQFSKTVILPGQAKRISRVEYKYGAGTGGSGKGMMRLYGYKVIKP